MLRRVLAIALLSSVLIVPATAGTIGMLVKYDGLKAADVAKLPADQQKVWQDYLVRSQAAHQNDVATLVAERKGLATVPPPVHDSFHDKSIPLDKPAAWYGSAEARREADVIASFQTPAGGWGKNQDYTKPARLKGQMWVPAEEAAITHPEDFGNPKATDWHYVGTIDNDATFLQMQFLAKVIAAAGDADASAWKASFIKGVNYLLAAEFPNGGWPQNYPLEGGYHDALTYNDDAFVNTVTTLAQVAANAGDLYGFVPMDLRVKAAAAVKRAEAVLLASQQSSNGKKTIWAQQHDPLTLKPVAARNFEPGVLSSTESGPLLVFLMSDPQPSGAVVTAVHDGIAFLKSLVIKDKVWKKGVMSEEPGALLWARFYDPVTLKPVFGDRDMTIHDDVNDLSPERRAGYSWFNNGGAKALKKYESWSKKHPK